MFKKFITFLLATILFANPGISELETQVAAINTPNVSPNYLVSLTPEQFSRNFLAMSTVKVSVMDLMTGVIGSGTGVSVEVKESGTRVLTAGHVCSIGGGFPIVSVTNILGQDFLASIVKVYDQQDLCLIEVDGIIPAYPLASSYSPRFGDAIQTVQAPLGLFPVARDGLFNFTVEAVNLYVLSLVSTSGASGCPVSFNGELIGIVISIASAAGGREWAGLTMAVPISTIHNFLEEVRLQDLPLAK